MGLREGSFRPFPPKLFSGEQVMSKDNSENNLSSKYTQGENQEIEDREAEDQVRAAVAVEEPEVEPELDIVEEEDEYRRVSDYERGDYMKPKWLEDNELVYASLELSFPYRAELKWRDGQGKRDYLKREQAVTAMFDPRYGRCPAPMKDPRGEWNYRCKYRIPAVPSAEDVARYNDPANRKGVMKNVQIRQWMAMMHMKENHFKWFCDEFGLIMKDNQGKEHKCPPRNDVVNFPEWEKIIKG